MLAIAGLIFLVVFLALPALQKSQRDTARRQDVAKAVAAIQQYYADGNDGKNLTTAVACGSNTLFDPVDHDPALGQYMKNAGFSSNVTSVKIMYDCPGPDIARPGVMEVIFGSKCGAQLPAGGYSIVATGSDYSAALFIRLETGAFSPSGGVAGAKIYCADAGR